MNDPDAMEIIDLPPETHGHWLLLKLTAQQKCLAAWLAHTQSIRVLISVCCGLALLFLLLGDVPLPFQTNSTALHTRSSTYVYAQIQIISLTQTPNPFPIAPAPPSCPLDTPLMHFSAEEPQMQGIGQGPVWVSGFSGPLAKLTTSTKLTLFVQTGLRGTLAMSGTNLTTGVPLSFIAPSVSPTLIFHQLLINLNNPTIALTVQGPWKLIPVEIILDNPGCYTLDASWNAHSVGWETFFLDSPP